jgi:hypothetical protein
MGVATSEVGYTSATTGTGDHEVYEGLVMAMGEKHLFKIGVRLGECLKPRPGRFYHGKGTWQPLYRWLGGTQGLSGRESKISPPPGYDPQTVHPAVSRHSDPRNSHTST